jgi:hypothetical protein
LFNVAIAGTVVAYAEGFAYGEGRLPNEDPTLVVRSITTGRVVHRARLHVVHDNGGALTAAALISILLKPSGTVAWIQVDGHGTLNNPTPPPEFDLFAIDTNGFHTLATGLSEPPKEARIVGSRLTWTASGTPHSSRLN